MPSPYASPPAYDTEHLSLRLVSEDDAEQLLSCYADPAAWPLFNTDACTGDFHCTTVEQVRGMLTAWRDCYARQEFLRCAVVDRATQLAVGTTEMFGRVGAYATPRGILRIDLAPAYEREDVLGELLELARTRFVPDFDVDELVTKAVPQAAERRAALSAAGYRPCAVPERGEHYFGVRR